MTLEEKKIAVACDHGGYALKLEILDYLQKNGYAYEDYGCDSPASVDYPVYAAKVCEAIQRGDSGKGILVCGTGIGMSMAANKFDGIRAACCTDTFSARMTRMHNNCNVLCLGGRVVGAGLALDIVKLYLETPFEGGRHERRVGMIADIEKQQKNKN